jgi:hypothetical protein
MLNGSLTSYVYASTYNNPTYPDYGFVFIHGTNTSNYNVWSISPDGPAKGSGLHFIYGANATNIHSTTPRISFIGSTGNVGIGTTSPSYNLSISGSAGLQGNEEYLYFHSNYSVGNNARGKIRVVGAGGGSGYGGDLRFSTRKPTNVWNEDALTIDSSGNVGIGTTSPLVELYLKDPNKNPSIRIDHSGGGNTFMKFQQFSGWNNSMTFTSDVGYMGINVTIPLILNENGQNVGIGTTSPAAKLEISSSTAASLLNVKGAGGNGILFVSGSGNVGIGTTVPVYKLEVNGSFAASTKSFKIDHPTLEGKKLVYGSLESPYHGIRLTGRNTLVGGKCKVLLPDYICKLVRFESVNIQLTGIKCGKILYIDEINVSENSFTVVYDKALFESYKTYDFFWDFTATRSDVPELITEV